MSSTSQAAAIELANLSTKHVSSVSGSDNTLLDVAKRASEKNEAKIQITLFPLGLAFIGTCLGALAWLVIHGPALVPDQDTRIPAFSISLGSRLCGLFMGAGLVRSAWASFLPHVLDGKPISTNSLVGTCRNFMSLGQWQNFDSLPNSFRFHIILAAYISLAMTVTSSSFRYDSFGTAGAGMAIVPDVASSCNPSLVNSSSYSCTGGATLANPNLNYNTSSASWNYLDDVNTGGQGTVYRYGKVGDRELGANVTLGIIPPGWMLSDGSDLPWMAIWVTCSPLPIHVDFYGSGFAATANIYVSGSYLDTLDIATLPGWNPVIYPYLQINQTGPYSTLSPYIVVYLERDLETGVAGMNGLADDSVTYLGVSYMALKGYPQPVQQNVRGAAAWCNFSGSTGGQWQGGLWPPLNTTNVVIGTLINNQPTLATALLNFGPSWVYSNVNGVGATSFIANITGPRVSFPDLYAAFIRNQWTLMAYSIAPQSGQQIDMPFIGSGPNKLYISLTLVSILPASALVLGLLVILRALVSTISYRHWVNRVEFESWWLIKALRSDLYSPGYGNATENVFKDACEGSVVYKDTRPESEVGHIALCSTTVDETPLRTSLLANDQRFYG